MMWKVWNTATPDTVYYIAADSFDEAIRKGRELDPDVSAGQPL